jgi:hypothetical protein
VVGTRLFRVEALVQKIEVGAGIQGPELQRDKPLVAATVSAPRDP